MIFLRIIRREITRLDSKSALIYYEYKLYHKSYSSFAQNIEITKPLMLTFGLVISVRFFSNPMSKKLLLS